MTYDTHSRIGDIVLENPATMRVFETLNIDYCCGGQLSLAEACANAHRDLALVLTQLETQAPSEPMRFDPKSWNEAPLVDLVAHIEAKHHSFTRSELERLAPLMEKVLKVHGGHHPELARVAQCFEAMHSDLIPHLAKEEQILFPYIRELESEGSPGGGCFGSVQNPIRAMENEHEQVGEILRELRTITNGYALPEEACGSYRSLYMGLQSLEEDLHLHIYLENHILFPRSIALEEAR